MELDKNYLRPEYKSYEKGSAFQVETTTPQPDPGPDSLGFFDRRSTPKGVELLSGLRGSAFTGIEETDKGGPDEF